MPVRACIAALALSVLSPPASAFFIPTGPPPPDTVYEYFNSHTGHYFYTWNPGDRQALESGAFGAGWMLTGQGFGAYGTRERGRAAPYPVDACGGQGSCLPVWRFYAPGPNSHFFTGSLADVAILDRPGTGWLLENAAFYTAMPDVATGKCVPERAPVHRLYNNRAALNDTNHRYTADESVRKVMVARGWVDEGVAFCAYGKAWVTTETHSFAVAQRAEVMGIDACRTAPAAGSCFGFANLPVPAHQFITEPVGMPSGRDEFERQTGMYLGYAPLVNLAVAGGSRTAPADDAFVQFMSAPRFAIQYAGVHLATQSRIAGPYSSITALRRLERGNVRPYRDDIAVERELLVTSFMAVQQARALSGSHAYGVISLQLTDETSGRSLLFNILSFGTAPAGEGAARDVNTSLPFVYTTLGTNSRFSTLWGSAPRAIERQVDPVQASAQVLINRRQFQAILDAAREVDPLLSPRPGDYSVANFGLINEAYGDGEIGVVIMGLNLSVRGAQ